MNSTLFPTVVNRFHIIFTVFRSEAPSRERADERVNKDESDITIPVFFESSEDLRRRDTILQLRLRAYVLQQIKSGEDTLSVFPTLKAAVSHKVEVE